MLTGALRETCSRAGMENQTSLYLDALMRMVVEVGRTGVAFVEEEVLAVIIDLAVGKATQVGLVGTGISTEIELIWIFRG